MANKNLICQECLQEVERFREECICDICYNRRKRMGSKYIPFKNLTDKQKSDLLKSREYNKKYLKRKSIENKTNEEIVNSFDHNVMKEEINSNLKEAFKKVELDEEIIQDDNTNSKINNLNYLLEVLNEISDFDKTKIEEQKAKVNKKISVIDNYIIDILHNLENTDLDDRESILYEGTKVIMLRKIRRKYKNEEKVLILKKKAFLSINKDLVKLNDAKKEIQSFKNSLNNHFYNPYVENPNNDDRILGLHKYRCQCKITSLNTDRKVIQFNEIIKAKSQDDAKEVAIQLLREKYGESVIWTKMYISFIR